MRGAWLRPGADLEVRDDLEEPIPGPGESLVEVGLAGVCATDLALAAGYMEFEGVPGHEFVGRALSGPLAGRRVVGEINAACGACPVCAGAFGLDGRHCPHRTVLGILKRGGAFAERLVLPDANLLPVPDGVSDVAASFAEPLAAAFQVVEQVPLEPGGRALVAGDGRLGLLIAKVLHAEGWDVTLAGHHAERVPPGVTGATGLLDADHAPPLAERFSLAVEATGAPAVLQRLCAHVRPGGTLVLKTTTGRAVPLDLTPVVVDELRIVGSRCGRFEVALEALAAGRIVVESLHQHTLPLGAAREALDLAGTRGVLKVLIDCHA